MLSRFMFKTSTYHRDHPGWYLDHQGCRLGWQKYLQFSTFTYFWIPIWWPGNTDPWQVPILVLTKQVLVIGIIKDDIEIIHDIMLDASNLVHRCSLACHWWWWSYFGQLEQIRYLSWAWSWIWSLFGFSLYNKWLHFDDYWLVIERWVKNTLYSLCWCYQGSCSRQVPIIGIIQDGI